MDVGCALKQKHQFQKSQSAAKRVFASMALVVDAEPITLAA
jgi:hypothetical protein